jgi:hypothetical protein
MPPFALRRSAKEEKVRSQFTRPAKSLFNSADLGSKAFSYVSATPNSFLSFSFLVLGFYPISQSLDPTDHQSITQSLIRSAHQICQSPLVGFAFSGSLGESRFFVHCSARQPTQSIAFVCHFVIICQLFVCHFIIVCQLFVCNFTRLQWFYSVFMRALFVHLQLPPLWLFSYQGPPGLLTVFEKDGGHFEPGTLL